MGYNNLVYFGLTHAKGTMSGCGAQWVARRPWWVCRWRDDGGGPASGERNDGAGGACAGGREAGLPMKTIQRVVLTDGACGSDGAFAT